MCFFSPFSKLCYWCILVSVAGLLDGTVEAGGSTCFLSWWKKISFGFKPWICNLEYQTVEQQMCGIYFFVLKQKYFQSHTSPVIYKRAKIELIVSLDENQTLQAFNPFFFYILLCLCRACCITCKNLCWFSSEICMNKMCKREQNYFLESFMHWHAGVWCLVQELHRDLIIIWT